MWLSPQLKLHSSARFLNNEIRKLFYFIFFIILGTNYSGQVRIGNWRIRTFLPSKLSLRVVPLPGLGVSFPQFNQILRGYREIFPKVIYLMMTTLFVCLLMYDIFNVIIFKHGSHSIYYSTQIVECSKLMWIFFVKENEINLY